MNDNKYKQIIINNIIVLLQNRGSMSDEKGQNQDQLKNPSRRSRKDDQGRDYICGCGKKYLSYPALYTHIKTKHGGNQPEGTQKTGVANMARRNKQKIDEKMLKEVYKYLNQQHIKILNQLEEHATGNVPVSHRIKRENPCKQIFQAYSNICKKQSSLTLNKESSLETILAVYLLNVGQYTSEPLYHYYLIFARQIRTCYYQHGQQVFENCFKGQGENSLKTFSIEQCGNAPIIGDFFIRYYIPQEHKDDSYQSLMKLLTYDFFWWMFDKKLTNIEVTLNAQYKILSKDIIQPKIYEKKTLKTDENPKQSNQGDSNESSDEEFENKPDKMDEQPKSVKSPMIEENQEDKPKEENQHIQIDNLTNNLKINDL